jgi:hypothetical protein
LLQLAAPAAEYVAPVHVPHELVEPYATVCAALDVPASHVLSVVPLAVFRYFPSPTDIKHCDSNEYPVPPSR